MILTKVFKTALKRNAPAILRGMGYGLAGIACFETGRSAIKASKIIEENNMNDGRFIDKAKLTWQLFIPPVILFAASVGCHAGSDIISIKRQATLIAIASAAESAKGNLKDAVKEVVGEKKAGKIEDAANQNKARRNLPKSPEVIEDTGFGKSLFYEPLTGKWFWSSHEKIIDVKTTIKDYMFYNDIAYVNDVIIEMGLKGCELGKYMGWSASQYGEHLDIGWIGAGSEDDRYYDPYSKEYIPYSIITYSIEPMIQSDMYGF